MAWGQEEGIALRLHDGHEVVFAAAAGSDERNLRWLLDRATHGYGPQLTGDRPWASGARHRLEDCDDSVALPSSEEIQAWLHRGLARLTKGGSAFGRRFVAARAWVEAASTVECWVADGGLVAIRTRVRAWAGVHPRVRIGPATREARPMIVASRRWADLEHDGWEILAGDRFRVAGRPAAPRAMKCPVLFSPEASATLVLALVRSLHGPGQRLDRPVGPGWKVIDDPLDPRALMGGSFDDACFPTEPRMLADGRTSVGLAEGPGCNRRSSYRDAPASRPSHLVVEPGDGTPPARAVLAATVALHPLTARNWIIEFEGGLLDSGQPGPTIERGFISTTPENLVQRCAAALGAVRDAYLGVRTPALLFDDLPVEIF